jgi:hypothetical protein
VNPFEAHGGSSEIGVTCRYRLAVRTIPESDLQLRFEELQRKLVSQWETIVSFNESTRAVVVVPSLSGVDLPLTPTKQQAYEERFLFLLFLLRQPRAELVYVTSRPIEPCVVDYYLGLLPGVVASHARRRLHLVTPHDASLQPLSAKLLERPRLLGRIRKLVGDPEVAHLVPFNTTTLERDLALRLGIPMYGADPKFNALGTKSGSRGLFVEAGIAHADGREGLRSRDELIDAVRELVAARPEVETLVLKLEEGVAGFGNALLDVRGLSEQNPSAAESRLADLEGDYLDQFAAQGGVVEELIQAEELRSPSVQMRATPLGAVELLSTHDQLLGGPDGLTFTGSVFPASDEYAREIAVEAMKVGELLAAQGVMGRFAVDFVTARVEGGWKSFAIEVNLRKGGTTHPYLTLQFLTGGAYDAEQALYFTPAGRTKFFVSTDRLESEAYRVLQPDDVFDLAVRERLHFDHTSQTGVVFHMMTALSEHGLIGLTAVGDSREQARALYDKTRELFDREAAAASEYSEPVG